MAIVYQQDLCFVVVMLVYSDGYMVDIKLFQSKIFKI